jgi:hypothetical protein
VADCISELVVRFMCTCAIQQHQVFILRQRWKVTLCRLMNNEWVTGRQGFRKQRSWPVSGYHLGIHVERLGDTNTNSYFLCPNVLPNTVFSNILIIFSYLRARGNILVLFIIIFRYLDMRPKGKRFKTVYPPNLICYWFLRESNFSLLVPFPNI